MDAMTGVGMGIGGAIGATGVTAVAAGYGMARGGVRQLPAKPALVATAILGLSIGAGLGAIVADMPDYDGPLKPASLVAGGVTASSVASGWYLITKGTSWRAPALGSLGLGLLAGSLAGLAVQRTREE